MDVDCPVSNTGTLKRCSSAPMINENNSVISANNSDSSLREQQNANALGTIQSRTRRFSASFSPVPGSPVSVHRLGRVGQLRQEEHADISNLRELAHEREVHHAMQISQSWEDLNLMEDSSSSSADGVKTNKIGPLHVSLPPYTTTLNCTSPSPTRLTSSGFQSPTRTSRTFIRRSASPVLRPSPLGVKRKLDEDKSDFYIMSPRIKKFHSYTTERGGLLTTSSNSLPESLGTLGTTESISSVESPNYNFRNMNSSSPNCVLPPQ